MLPQMVIDGAHCALIFEFYLPLDSARLEFLRRQQFRCVHDASQVGSIERQRPRVEKRPTRRTKVKFRRRAPRPWLGLSSSRSKAGTRFELQWTRILSAISVVLLLQTAKCAKPSVFVVVLVACLIQVPPYLPLDYRHLSLAYSKERRVFRACTPQNVTLVLPTRVLLNALFQARPISPYNNSDTWYVTSLASRMALVVSRTKNSTIERF